MNNNDNKLWELSMLVHDLQDRLAAQELANVKLQAKLSKYKGRMVAVVNQVNAAFAFHDARLRDLESRPSQEVLH